MQANAISALAPDFASCGAFSKFLASHEGISCAWPCGSQRRVRMSRWEMRMRRWGYRNPCALVAARLLLNTTWSL